MIRRPPSSTRTDTLFPYTTLFRSAGQPPWLLLVGGKGEEVRQADVVVQRPAQAGGVHPSLLDLLRDHHVVAEVLHAAAAVVLGHRSEEHTSELQSLMRISYAVFCLKKKKKSQDHT